MSSFEEQIRSWVAVDNQLKVLQDKSKELRDRRASLNEVIMGHVADNSMEGSTVRISDGRLRFVASNQTSPLTLKFVQECLLKCIQNGPQVEQIMTFIKAQRETKVKTEVKRFYIKNE